MKITCVDVVNGYTKKGTPFVQGAFRGVGKSGSPFLFVANCPPDYEPLKSGWQRFVSRRESVKDYEARVIFSPNGNFILPY